MESNIDLESMEYFIFAAFLTSSVHSKSAVRLGAFFMRMYAIRIPSVRDNDANML